MGVDVLDLTALQKRGLLKVSRHEPDADVVDLTRASPAPIQPTSASTPETSSAFDFLSSFAQSSAPARSESTSSLPSGSEMHAKLDTIINKLEDTMYKIEVLSGRIAQVETRLGSRE